MQFCFENICFHCYCFECRSHIDTDFFLLRKISTRPGILTVIAGTSVGRIQTCLMSHAIRMIFVNKKADSPRWLTSDNNFNFGRYLVPCPVRFLSINGQIEAIGSLSAIIRCIFNSKSIFSSNNRAKLCNIRYETKFNLWR